MVKSTLDHLEPEVINHPNNRQRYQAAQKIIPQNFKSHEIAATVQPSHNKAIKWMQSSHPTDGTLTGQTPAGIRAIINNLRGKVAALPANEFMVMNGITPELHQRYTKILEKMMPNQFFRGALNGEPGGNYVASPKLHQSWIPYLSRVLPTVGVLDTARQIQNWSDDDTRRMFQRSSDDI